MDEQSFQYFLQSCNHEQDYLTFLMKNNNLISIPNIAYTCYKCRKNINNEQIRLNLFNKKFF